MLAATFSFGQMGAPMPTEELKKLDFLVGDYSGTEKISFGPQTANSKSNSKGEMMLGGRYLHTVVDYTIEGAPTMHGMHMLTYDPVKKSYECWWFDSETSAPMHLSGNFIGDKLVVTSDPTDMPGMGKVVIRTSWWKNGDKGVRFLLEMQQGDTWATMMDGDYHKS